ncbi:MAG: hypothetical protein ACSHX4_10565 [Opitutaceae bacterium]
MAQLDPLPPALSETLSRFPAQGERNIWLFEVAARARHIASPERVQNVLENVVAHQGWTDRDFGPEIRRAVRRAYADQQDVSHEPLSRAAPWPVLDEDYRASLLGKTLRFDPRFAIDLPTETVIDSLYASDDLLCFAELNCNARTEPREKWRGREQKYQFIVANPMTALNGLTQEGKRSYRCHGNATQSRIYQVVEFDQGPLEEQAAILSSLDSVWAPLILVVWSGSKSLHGWFDVRLLDEAQKREFFAQACRGGADRTLWDQSKLVRMPGGTRTNNRQRQSILFFDPRHIIHIPSLPTQEVTLLVSNDFNTYYGQRFAADSFPPRPLGADSRTRSKIHTQDRTLRRIQVRLTGRFGCAADSQLGSNPLYRAQLRRASRKAVTREGQHPRGWRHCPRTTHQYLRAGGHR